MNRVSEEDIIIGTYLRAQRKLVGFTQGELADEMGISFQQLQKYENGINRISAGKLWKASKIMNLPISDFFADNDLTGDSNRSNKTLRLFKLYNACSDRNKEVLEKIAHLLAYNLTYDDISPTSGTTKNI